MQEQLIADDVQGDASQCATTLQMQELTAHVGQSDCRRKSPTGWRNAPPNSSLG
jgi:hypothetical protein